MRMQFIWSHLLAAVLSFSVSADFAMANRFYQAQDYQAALPELQQLAQFGHAEAQLLLSTMYQYGYGVPADVYKAYAWALTARGFQQPGANEKYLQLRAELPSRRIGKQAFVEINQQYGAVAMEGSLYPAIHHQPQQPKKIDNIRQPKPDYPDHFERSGAIAWAVVRFDINENGRVENSKVELSYPNQLLDQYVLKAIQKWTFEPPQNAYGDAIRLDHQIQVFNLTRAQTAKRKSILEHQNYLAAVKEAATAGYAKYQYTFGLIAEAGLVKDETAIPWFLKAAINGNALAQFSIAQCLISGSWCDKDPNKAINWLTFAAGAGDPKASYLLAQQLLDSDNIQFDPHRAAAYLEKAATGHYVPALIEYASLLVMSDDPQLRDANKAIQLAQQGLQQEPNHPKLLSAMGIALIEQGKAQQGAELLQQAVTAAQERDWQTDSYQQLVEEYTLLSPLTAQ